MIRLLSVSLRLSLNYSSWPQASWRNSFPETGGREASCKRQLFGAQGALFGRIFFGISYLNRWHPKRRGWFSNHQFSAALLGRVVTMWWLVVSSDLWIFTQKHVLQLGASTTRLFKGSRVRREVRVACLAFSRNFSSGILINLGELQCGNLPKWQFFLLNSGMTVKHIWSFTKFTLKWSAKWSVFWAMGHTSRLNDVLMWSLF